MLSVKKTEAVTMHLLELDIGEKPPTLVTETEETALYIGTHCPIEVQETE